MNQDQEPYRPITGSKLWKPTHPVTFTCENEHRTELSFWEDDTGECPSCGSEITDVEFFTDDLSTLRELLRGLEWRATAIAREQSLESKRDMAWDLVESLQARIDRAQRS